MVAERADQPHRLLERMFDLEAQAVEPNGLVVISMPKVPIWKPRYFNALRLSWRDRLMIGSRNDQPIACCTVLLVGWRG
jgi:hypothetical protein